MNDIYYVYMHTNKINGKSYVGMTKQGKERWGKNGIRYKGNKEFWNDIQKYGWDNFDHIILLKTSDKEEAQKSEIYNTLKYKTFIEEYGYNRRICNRNVDIFNEIIEKLNIEDLERQIDICITDDRLVSKKYRIKKHNDKYNKINNSKRSETVKIKKQEKIERENNLIKELLGKKLTRQQISDQTNFSIGKVKTIIKRLKNV